MLNILVWAAFLILPSLSWAAPHVQLQVQLNPQSRLLSAQATVSDAHDLKQLYLATAFQIRQVQINEKTVAPASLRSKPDARVLKLPPGARQVRLEYEGTIAATPAIDQRQLTSLRAGTAGSQGSFLPGSALWFPHPGQLFTYRTTLTLPAGQKGLVAGSLVHEAYTAQSYQAIFEFRHPAETIDLMAGPYVTQDHTLKLGSRQVQLRTWFYPELAPLANDYLNDSAQYIERYSKQIGDYPFDVFSIVASPTPTGYGMPSLTYLGKDVLRLPFIRATSLGHEILHNWWGNGVYPDWDSGNWSEGLTTFMADYAYAEDQSEATAREMRMGWLRDYAAVPPTEDFALTQFTSRHGGISSIIGYNKGAMVFLMLRDRLGHNVFERGLRLLWQTKQFQTASWQDLQHAFEQASGQDLNAFFDTWVKRAGAPPFKGSDPDYRVWRRIDPNEFPPILREVFVAPQAQVWVLDEVLKETAQTLALRVLDHPMPVHLKHSQAAQHPLRAIAPESPTFVVGLHDTVDAWLKALGINRPPFSKGTAWVWAVRIQQHHPMVVVSARNIESLLALQRSLPHYGKQSGLVFEGARVIQRGTSQTDGRE